MGNKGYQNKDALIAENIKLTADLKSLQVKYEEFSKLIARYNQLKDMIKEITGKKWIKKAQEALGTPSGLPENMVDEPAQPQADRGTVGLSEKSMRFAGYAHDLERKSKFERDLNTLTVQKVREDNEKKRKQLGDLYAKFSRFLNHLKELQKGYEESKKLTVINRYGKMRELVKIVITDTYL